jgi:capsular polysaccharide biosynthesis protein
MTSTPNSLDFNLSGALQRLVGMFWVRRYLILTPLLLSIPLGLVAAFALPRAYVAKTLLLLQEGGSDSPLSREVRSPESTRDRITGLQTLIKSERIMRAVLKEKDGGTFPESQVALAQAIQDLSRNLSLDVLTNDIIEVRLKGSKPQGMGRTLEIITGQLLESLLSPEENILTAPQMLVERRREQVEIAERALKAFIERTKTSTQQAPARASDNSTEESMRNSTELARLMEDQAKTLTAIDKLRSDLMLRNWDRATLDASIGRARLDVARAPVRSDAANEEAGMAARQLEKLLQLQDLETQHETRARDIAQLIEKSAKDAPANLTSEDIVKQRRSLETVVALARERYDATTRRFGQSTNVGPLQILRAPERITIVDPPKDPELATIGRATILLISILGGLMIGLGLTFFADLLDQRVRSRSKLEQLVGAPVLARLPHE